MSARKATKRPAAGKSFHQLDDDDAYGTAAAGRAHACSLVSPHALHARRTDPNEAASSTPAGSKSRAKRKKGSSNDTEDVIELSDADEDEVIRVVQAALQKRPSRKRLKQCEAKVEQQADTIKKQLRAIRQQDEALDQLKKDVQAATTTSEQYKQQLDAIASDQDARRTFVKAAKFVLSGVDIDSGNGGHIYDVVDMLPHVTSQHKSFVSCATNAFTVPDLTVQGISFSNASPHFSAIGCVLRNITSADPRFAALVQDASKKPFTLAEVEWYESLMRSLGFTEPAVKALMQVFGPRFIPVLHAIRRTDGWEVAQKIGKQGFHPGTWGWFGPGVYSSIHLPKILNYCTSMTERNSDNSRSTFGAVVVALVEIVKKRTTIVQIDGCSQGCDDHVFCYDSNCCRYHCIFAADHKVRDAHKCNPNVYVVSKEVAEAAEATHKGCEIIDPMGRQMIPIATAKVCFRPVEHIDSDGAAQFIPIIDLTGKGDVTTTNAIEVCAHDYPQWINKYLPDGEQLDASKLNATVEFTCPYRRDDILGHKALDPAEPINKYRSTQGGVQLCVLMPRSKGMSAFFTILVDE